MIDSRFSIGSIETTPKAVEEIDAVEEKHLSCGIECVDNFLSGGLVPGQIVVIAGDSGIGKTTWLLQFLEAYEINGVSTAFASNEESLQQLKAKCDRLELKKIKISHIVSVYTILKLIETNQVVVIDSLQGVMIPDEKGSIDKKVLNLITGKAKLFNTSVVLISHATKAGKEKGNSSIGHQVDTRIIVNHGSDAFFMERPGIFTIEKTRFGKTGSMCWDMRNGKFDMDFPFFMDLYTFDRDFFKRM